MNIPLSRLSRLSDLLFAASLTILIMLMELPSEADLSSREAFELYLDNSIPRLTLFIITFIIVAIYWVKDVGQFKYIQKTDGTHTWLQLGSLAFLMILPWTNALFEINPDHLGVRIIYSIDIFLIGLFSSLAWIYASKNHRLINKELEKKEILQILEANLTEPIVALIAIGIAFVWPDFFTSSFILIPLLYGLQKKVRQRLSDRSANRSS